MLDIVDKLAMDSPVTGPVTSEGPPARVVSALPPWILPDAPCLPPLPNHELASLDDVCVRDETAIVDDHQQDVNDGGTRMTTLKHLLSRVAYAAYWSVPTNWIIHSASKSKRLKDATAGARDSITRSVPPSMVTSLRGVTASVTSVTASITTSGGNFGSTKIKASLGCLARFQLLLCLVGLVYWQQIAATAYVMSSHNFRSCDSTFVSVINSWLDYVNGLAMVGPLKVIGIPCGATAMKFRLLIALGDADEMDESFKMFCVVVSALYATIILMPVALVLDILVTPFWAMAIAAKYTGTSLYIKLWTSILAYVYSVPNVWGSHSLGSFFSLSIGGIIDTWLVSSTRDTLLGGAQMCADSPDWYQFSLDVGIGAANVVLSYASVFWYFVFKDD